MSLPEGKIRATVPSPKVIGVPREFLKKGVDADVLERFEETLGRLKKAGYEIRDVDMPSLPYGLAVYYIIMPAEVSTNLARFDGIRYGHSVPADTIQEVYTLSRGQGFGPEARRRILLGTFVLSAGYADAYYRKARAVRSVIRKEFEDVLKTVDVIVTPSTPTPAFKFGEKTADPLAMYAADIFTVPVNLAGVPSASVPTGTVVRDGKALPVGFQIMGGWGNEETVFSVAAQAEQITL